jgi:hypothetical protein
MKVSLAVVRSNTDRHTFAGFLDPAPALDAGNGAGAAFFPDALGGYH